MDAAQHGANNRFSFGAAECASRPTSRSITISAPEQINGGWTFERDHADYAQGMWPTNFRLAHHQPQVLTLNFTSTLSPSCSMKSASECAGRGPTPSMRWRIPRRGKDAIAFIPNVQGIPVLPQLGMNAVAPWTSASAADSPCSRAETPGALFNGNIAEKTNLYTYADAMTWTKSKHTFKGGGEVRLGSSFFGDDVEGGNFSALRELSAAIRRCRRPRTSTAPICRDFRARPLRGSVVHAKSVFAPFRLPEPR